MHIQELVATQMDRIDLIAEISRQVALPEIIHSSLDTLETTMDLLTSNWDKIEAQHEKLIATKVGGAFELPYFRNRVFGTALKQCAAARSALAQFISRKAAGGDVSFRVPVRNNSIAEHNVSGRPKLPIINLPAFDGDYSKWSYYSRYFISMVVKPTAITPVEKMHHLLSSLKGEPHQLVSSMDIDDNSFAVAWNLLEQRYQNKRLIISVHLDHLLNPPAMTSHTAAELNRLDTTVSHAMTALRALGSPVDHWDQIVVHNMVQRFSPKLREAWEIEVGASMEYPLYDDLKTFITARSRALERMQLNFSKNDKAQENSGSSRSGAAQQKSQKGNAASVNVTTQHSTQKAAQKSSQKDPKSVSQPAGSSNESWADLSKYPCSFCSGDHFIVSCSAFRALDPAARRKVAAEKGLCWNCLGKHRVGNCKLLVRFPLKRCQLCGEKHHSLIHVDSRPTQLNSASAQSTQTVHSTVTPHAHRVPVVGQQVNPADASAQAGNTSST